MNEGSHGSLSKARLLFNLQCLEVEQKFKSPFILRVRKIAKSYDYRLHTYLSVCLFFRPKWKNSAPNGRIFN